MTHRLTARWRWRATRASIILAPMVHLKSLDQLAHRVTRHPLPPADPSVDDEALVDWIDRFTGVLPWPWRYTCLKRGLALFALFQRAGRPADLVVGVRRSSAGALEAHAWLVRENTPVFERQAQRLDSYQEITRFRGTR